MRRVIARAVSAGLLLVAGPTGVAHADRLLAPTDTLPDRAFVLDAAVGFEGFAGSPVADGLDRSVLVGGARAFVGAGMSLAVRTNIMLNANEYPGDSPPFLSYLAGEATGTWWLGRVALGARATAGLGNDTFAGLGATFGYAATPRDTIWLAPHWRFANVTLGTDANGDDVTRFAADVGLEAGWAWRGDRVSIAPTILVEHHELGYGPDLAFVTSGVALGGGLTAALDLTPKLALVAHGQLELDLLDPARDANHFDRGLAYSLTVGVSYAFSVHDPN